MISLDQTFRLNMKFYREQGKFSQSQLAIGADCTNGLIGQIEAGITKPSFDRTINIAAALHVHPADLFLRNASVTVSGTKQLLKTELLPQIADFIDRRLKRQTIFAPPFLALNGNRAQF